MMLPFELLLPLGALAFYVYDCGMLLYDNELLFLGAGRHWRVDAGSRQLLFRRRLSLPGLLQPWLAIYRYGWSDELAPDLVRSLAVGPADLPGRRPLQLVCTLMLLLLLPVMPLVSLGYGAGWALLSVFALYYVLILVALALIWWHRRQWSLGRRAFAVLALDALACAPFAANLLRRVTLRQRCAADGVALARVVCAEPERRQLLAVLQERLADRIAVAKQGDPLSLRLQQRSRQLEVELT